MDKRPQRWRDDPYLAKALGTGLVAIVVAAIVLSATITILYRRSIMAAEDRASLAEATALLSSEVRVIGGGRPAKGQMGALAMTAEHVRALVPEVRAVHIMLPDGTQMYGSGKGPVTQSVPLRGSDGRLIASVGLSVVERSPLDAQTLTFIAALALATIGLSALPQVVLAQRAVRVLAAQREGAENAYVATLISLSGTLELRDPYTANHSRRVAMYAEAIALHIALPADEVRVIREGALLHDLGKVAVPDAVLLKNGPLDESERALIERHPVVGADVLGAHESLREVRDCVLHHHERFDGLGYPHGLCGAQVPRSARIVAVADAYDAMTTDRPYRQALSPDTAFGRLRSGSGTQWEELYVEALIAAVRVRTPYSSFPDELPFTGAVKSVS